MANQQLIKGAGDVYKSEGFYDLGAAVGKGLQNAAASFNAVPGRVLANQKYQQEVNNYMSQLKTDIDFTGFTQKETGILRDFLMTERNKYTDAAKMAAKYTDTTHPDYLMYVDQMQAVNNSFTNLAAQLKSYKKNKLEYADSQMQGLVSDGTDPNITYSNNKVYGFYDVDGDGYVDEGYDAPFNIQDGGNLAFYMDDGTNLSYNNLKAVNYKNYTAASNILKTNENIYKSGKLVTNEEATLYKLNLQETLQDVKTMQSLIFDFRTELGGGAPDNPNDPGSAMYQLGQEWDRQSAAGQVDLADMRSRLTSILLDTYITSGKNGKKEQDRKNPPTNDTKGYLRGKTVMIDIGDGVKEYYVYTHPDPNKENIYKPTGGTGSPSGNGPTEVEINALTQAYQDCRIPAVDGKLPEMSTLTDAQQKCVYKKYSELNKD